MTEDELLDENKFLRGRLESAHRKVCDLEHNGLHGIVVRELRKHRNIDVREMDDVVTIRVGLKRSVARDSLYSAIAAAWREE